MTCTDSKTPFDILGVSPADDLAMIRRAWKRLVKQNHPDRCPAEAEARTRRLIELNAAFDALRDHEPIGARRDDPHDFDTQSQRRAAREAAAQEQAEADARKAAKAKARAEAARRKAEADRQAQAARTREAKAARSTRPAPPLSQQQQKKLRHATRSFCDARCAFTDLPRPGFAYAA